MIPRDRLSSNRKNPVLRKRRRVHGTWLTDETAQRTCNRNDSPTLIGWDTYGPNKHAGRPGLYYLAAEAPGFHPERVPVEVEPDQVAKHRFLLHPE